MHRVYFYCHHLHHLDVGGIEHLLQQRKKRKRRMLVSKRCFHRSVECVYESTYDTDGGAKALGWQVVAEASLDNARVAMGTGNAAPNHSNLGTFLDTVSTVNECDTLAEVEFGILSVLDTLKLDEREVGVLSVLSTFVTEDTTLAVQTVYSSV